MVAISIHAPREGSDLEADGLAEDEHGFQSTLPVRGATAGLGMASWTIGISIHAPREGSDSSVL